LSGSLTREIAFKDSETRSTVGIVEQDDSEA
jgi:hypothetical protein